MAFLLLSGQWHTKDSKELFCQLGPKADMLLYDILKVPSLLFYLTMLPIICPLLSISGSNFCPDPQFLFSKGQHLLKLPRSRYAPAAVPR